MAANVTYIPPKAAKPEALRVAAYCRVSSDSSDQLHSYATQIKAYTEQIGAHADWELVDVYADEGLTGTRMDKREDFQRLLADCRKGKVDRVLCKSISRFARNTKDCLAALRELSALGVTVYFEKENIDTGTLTSELMVSVSGALAQQESISISQNQRMSYKRRMERGEFITCKAPFGYRLVEGKELEIIPEEAERVRWIFASYLSGKSLEWIAEQMEKAGIPTPDNAPYWQKTSILYILTNEKYIGDSLNQKYLSGGFHSSNGETTAKPTSITLKIHIPLSCPERHLKKYSNCSNGRAHGNGWNTPVPPWSGRSGAANAGLCSAVGRGVAVW